MRHVAADVALIVSEYVPVGQAVVPLALAKQYEPAGHVRHVDSEVALCVAEYDPAGQAVSVAGVGQ